MRWILIGTSLVGVVPDDHLCRLLSELDEVDLTGHERIQPLCLTHLHKQENLLVGNIAVSLDQILLYGFGIQLDITECGFVID